MSRQLRRSLWLQSLESRMTPTTIAWNGSIDGNWSKDGNWDGGSKPGTGDIAQFNAGKPSVVVDAAQTVTAIELNGGWNGTVSLSANLTTTGAGSLWNSGQVSGPGTWNAGGTITLAGSTPTLNGAGLNITGTLTHTTANNLNAGSGATITVAGPGIYDFQSDATIYYAFGAAPVTNVLGTVKKTSGGGTSAIQGIVNNQGGTWDAQSGTLAMVSAGGTHTGGTFKASAGAGLNLTGGQSATWKGSYTGSGTGVVYVNSGTVTVDAAGANFNFPAGLFEWDGGTIVGGTLTNAGAVKLNGGGVQLNGATWNNTGTFTHKTADNLNYGAGAQFINDVAGVVDFQSDGDFYWQFGAEPTLINKGLIKKTGGTDNTYVRAVLHNQGGAWEAQTGTLQMQSDGGLHTGGAFTAAPGAVVNLNGNISATWEGNYSASGGGVVGIGGGGITPGAAGMTFNFPSDTPFGWYGGTIGGGKFTNLGFVDLVGGGVGLQGGATTFDNSGTVRHFTGANFDYGTGATFNNLAAGVYEFRSDGDVYWNAGAIPTFNNKGLVRKLVATGDTFIQGVLNNQGGSWDAQTGQLIMQSSNGTHTGGTFTASAGAAVNLTGGQSATWQGTYTGSGAGTVYLNSGTIAPGAGGVTFNFTAPGLFQWNGGTLSGGVINNTGFVDLNGGVQLQGASTVFNNSGTLRHITGANLDYGTSSTFNNLAAGVYEFRSDGDIFWNAGAIPTFNNHGLVRKLIAIGDSFIQGSLNNLGGSWDAQTGQLTMASSGGTHTGGTFTVAAGAAVNVTGGQSATWTGTYSGTGAGAVYLNSGIINPGAGGVTFNFTTPGLFQLNGGTLTSGVITNSGIIDFNGGNVQLQGAATVFTNSGTVRHFTSSNLDYGNQATINNTSTGVYEFRSDADIYWNSGSAPTFNNQGMIRKTVGTGETQIQGTLNNLGGAWDAQTGTLTLASFGGSHASGTFQAAAGAAINLTGGQTATWQGVFSGSGAGVVALSSGTINPGLSGVTFNFTTPGLFQLNGGNLSSGVITNAGFLDLNGGNVQLQGPTTVFTNSGTVRHFTGNNLDYGSQATFNNTSTGVYEFRSDADIYWNAGIVPTFNNQGLIRKLVGAGTSEIFGNFVNAGGIVDVQTGAIAIPAGFNATGGGVLGMGTLQAAVTNADGFTRPGPITGTLTIQGDYTQGTAGLFIPEIKGTAPGDVTALQVNGKVALGGLLVPQLNFSAKVNDNFVVLANDGVEPITGSFANVPEGGSLTVLGTTFQVTYKGGDGNDVSLKVTNVASPGSPVTPPKVTLVAPNGGGAQRSRVTGLLVRYDQPVSHAGTLGDAYQLTRQNDSASVALTGSAPTRFNSTFTALGVAPTVADFAYLTFAPGTAVEARSLADGRYTLTAVASQVSSGNGQLDGDGNGTGGDNYTLVGDPATNKLFRLFGDINGDGFTDNLDLIVFRAAIGSDSTMMNYNPAFDVNADGFIDNLDLLAFRERLGVTP